MMDALTALLSAFPRLEKLTVWLTNEWILQRQEFTVFHQMSMRRAFSRSRVSSLKYVMHDHVRDDRHFTYLDVLHNAMEAMKELRVVDAVFPVPSLPFNPLLSLLKSPVVTASTCLYSIRPDELLDSLVRLGRRPERPVRVGLRRHGPRIFETRFASNKHELGEKGYVVLCRSFVTGR